MSSDCTAKEKEPPTKEETAMSSSLPHELALSCLTRLSTSDNKKDETSLSPSFPLSSLPDELVLTCLARVSRSDYKALSLVSKRYRSLVVSPELYKTRSLLGYTERYLYVCLRTGQTHNNTTQPWLILRRENSETVMTRFPPLPSQFPKSSSMVALDWGIYVIGGFIKGKPTSNVLLLDCRTNTWRKLPSMAVARSLAVVGVVDKKIYVFGGCDNNIDSLNYGEVFDPKTQTWDTLVPMPDQNILLKRINASFVIEEKIYAVENTWAAGEIIQRPGLYYSPSEGKWGIRNINSEPHRNPMYVMIDKLLYCWELLYLHDYPRRPKLYWCEKEEFKWKEVKGLDLEKLFHWPARFQKLSNFGDNIVVFWCVDDLPYTGSKIWCAEISLERRRKEGDEIWGKVEWSDALITLDHPLYDYGKLVSHSVSVNL